MPHASRTYWIVFIGLVVVLAATDADADATLAIVPEQTVVAPGSEFVVEIALPEAGDPINGYDAVVGYDPSRLELILPVPRSSGEGPLFTDACAQRFLNVSVAPDSTVVSVSHVLLCAGTAVTGPGAMYQLRFRARETVGRTDLLLLGGTAAYNAGEYVEPLQTLDASVWVGEGTNAPALASSARLTAVPNPFNPRTELRYELPSSQRVRLEVFDVSGRRIGTVYQGWASSGPIRIPWDGRDGRGRPLASGVYIARLSTSTGLHAVTRMVLVR